MKKILFPVALIFAFVVSATLSAHAQNFGGCPDSPENPTLILAGLASGAFGVSQLRTRLRARRKSRTPNVQ